MTETTPRNVTTVGCPHCGAQAYRMCTVRGHVVESAAASHSARFRAAANADEIGAPIPVNPAAYSCSWCDAKPGDPCTVPGGKPANGFHNARTSLSDAEDARLAATRTLADAGALPLCDPAASVAPTPAAGPRTPPPDAHPVRVVLELSAYAIDGGKFTITDAALDDPGDRAAFADRLDAVRDALLALPSIRRVDYVSTHVIPEADPAPAPDPAPDPAPASEPAHKCRTNHTHSACRACGTPDERCIDGVLGPERRACCTTCTIAETHNEPVGGVNGCAGCGQSEAACDLSKRETATACCMTCDHGASR